MSFIKNHLKFIVGIAVLILAASVFFVLMKSKNLEDGELRAWRAASESRRAAAVKILTGGEEHNEIMVACIDRIAEMPDSAKVKIKDAAALCYTGVMLKDNL